MSKPPNHNLEFAHARRREVAWMSQNTNTLPVHPEILEAIRRSLDEEEFRLYPPRAGVPGLADAIREDLGTPDADVSVTNGGIEGVYVAMRALLEPGDEVLTTDPSFLPLHEQVRMAGAKPVELDIYREPWVLTPEAAEAAVTPATRMILLVDPNNPLGSGLSAAQVRGIAEVARDHALWLVHDATYRDFNPDHELAWAHAPERTLVSYSFSKGPGLAGMRVGAILGPPETAQRLRGFDTNVLGVNVLAQRAALAALRVKGDWLPELRRVCEANQRTIKGAVSRVEGASLPVFPSKANMFVVDISRTGVDPERVEERLLREHLVHVRAGSYTSKRFGDRFLRVSFTVPEADAARFASGFPTVVEALRA